MVQNVFRYLKPFIAWIISAADRQTDRGRTIDRTVFSNNAL